MIDPIICRGCPGPTRSQSFLKIVRSLWRLRHFVPFRSRMQGCYLRYIALHLNWWCSSPYSAIFEACDLLSSFLADEPSLTTAKHGNFLLDRSLFSESWSCSPRLWLKRLVHHQSSTIIIWLGFTDFRFIRQNSLKKNRRWCVCLVICVLHKDGYLTLLNHNFMHSFAASVFCEN